MKPILLSIVFAGVLIGGAVMFSRESANNTIVDSVKNVAIVDGKQIVIITAKGKYSPSISIAKAEVPTVLRMQTNGTFDCTSALTIPALGYRANLPPSGVTEIEIPPQKQGTNLNGICGMGMYSFSINFN